MKHLTRLLEAALFSADRPLSLGELRSLDPGVDRQEVEEALAELQRLYDEEERGIELVELADGFQVLTRAEFAEAIAQARIASRPRKLSPAALETLAIIAYRQPVGRSEIEDIRGVAADGVLRSLQERGLIDVAGRGEGLGRPLLYGTTDRFLEMLGLKDLLELPRLEELSVALRPAVESFEGRGLGKPLDEMLREVGEGTDVADAADGTGGGDLESADLVRGEWEEMAGVEAPAGEETVD